MKIWPEYYSAVRAGQKRAELRWNDRDYQAGDNLDLCEWDPNEEAFTGESPKSPLHMSLSLVTGCRVMYC
ncbi:DUF3850 domain-containing protein [Enterobacter cancerogenus]|uniref:DUF3850 domain-containing protein n=1 Tax=Enterobacter cancerogenus TaxID=69218 RepID=UPI0034D28E4D